MKQLLTVTVILICSFLSERFTIADQSKTGLPVTNTAHPAFNKWKNTAWVNPWADVKKNPASEIPLNTARIYWSHDCNFPQYVYRFYVTIAGTEYEGCVVPSGQTDQYDIPAGAWVHIDIEVHHTYGGFDAYVEDHTAGVTPFFDDIRPYANYSFQVQAGHEYTVWTYTY